MADILFVHNNFPGQFGHVAWALKRNGHRVAAIASQQAGRVPGVPIAKYESPPTTAGVHPWAQRIERDVRFAELGLAQALRLRQEGFDPKVIVAHPAWGDALVLREVFPNARRIMHGELYVATEGGDLGFDPEFGEPTFADRARARLINLGLAQPYLEADVIVCPTPWQASLFPADLQPKIRIIHEGIGTHEITPDPAASFILPDGRALGRATPLITYVSRKLEPLRGYHIFMRALPQVLAALPTAEVLIVGAEGQSYTRQAAPPDGWRARYFDEVKDRLDPSRIHFTGKLPHDQMVKAVQASSAHVYYSYPFVVSWSLMEAMSAGALVLASDTAPIRDVLTDGENALLGDFFDVEGLAARIVEVCRDPTRYAHLREAARQTVVQRYDRETLCLPAWLSVIDAYLTPA